VLRGQRGSLHRLRDEAPLEIDEPTLKVVTLLFAPNPELFPTLSSCAGYDATWVDKLARGVRRHLRGAEVICLVDREYDFQEPVKAVPMLRPDLGYFAFIEAFRPDLGIERGLFAQLDTIVTGSLADIASLDCDLAMPRDPYFPGKLTDSVMLFGRERADALWQSYWSHPDELAKRYRIAKWARPDGYPSEFYWIRDQVGQMLTYLDDVLPGQVVSYKRSCLSGVDDQLPDGQLEPTREELDAWMKRHPTIVPANARMVVFGGLPHPNQITASPGSEALIRHWR